MLVMLLQNVISPLVVITEYKLVRQPVTEIESETALSHCDFCLESPSKSTFGFILRHLFVDCVYMYSLGLDVQWLYKFISVCFSASLLCILQCNMLFYSNTL